VVDMLQVPADLQEPAVEGSKSETTKEKQHIPRHGYNRILCPQIYNTRRFLCFCRVFDS